MTLAGLGLAFVAIAWCGLYYVLGVWPPDIGSRKASVLASAESVSGERFKVVQYWSWFDFYRTQVEDISPDGTVHVAVIDGDDRKQWPCAAQVIEPEKKLVIALSDHSPPIEYMWDKKWFVTPSGSVRVRP
jgi:hypothetical protein